MPAISELLQVCLAQFISLINSERLSDHTEVPLHEWRDELGRLRVWAANIGAHRTGQSSLDYRLRDASHIKGQIVRLLERVKELLTDLEDVLEEKNDCEAQDDRFKDLGEISESENSTTEIQEIHQGLFETIIQLYQISIIIRKPAQHDRLVGIDKLDAETFQFWAKQHTSNKYPNADALAIDRISYAMARQRAILKYRERHHAKLSQGIDSKSDSKSTMLSETEVTDVFKETPGQFSDMVSDTGVSETSYGGTLLEGTVASAPKIPPIPKKGVEQGLFECPYCFYIITVRDKRAWARHIFRDLMPYVCIFPGCSTPNKLYECRRQWYHHIRQTHASTFSTDRVYDCSICKQGSLPVTTFEQHVGEHLEELALFLLPRTYSDEDENAVTDEEKGVGSVDDNFSDASLEEYSVEQSVEQRNDMNIAAQASDSDLGDDNPLGGAQNESKPYTSAVGTNVGDGERTGVLESNTEYKGRASPSSYERHYELTMGMETWKQQQEIERELAKYRERAEVPLDVRELRLQREEEEWYEDEISDRLRRLERFERRARTEEERKKAEHRWRLEKFEEAEREAAGKEKLKEIAKAQEEAAEIAKLKAQIIAEEKQKAIEEEEKKQKEIKMKKVSVEEWKMQQKRIKQKEKEEQEQKDKEFRERLRKDFGYTEEEIEEKLKKKDEKKKGKALEETSSTTWIKVHRKHLLPETLVAYNLPWDWDDSDSNNIIIKRWISEDLQEELFSHTRRLRENKVIAQKSSSTTALRVNDRGNDKTYLVQKKSPGRGRQLERS